MLTVYGFQNKRLVPLPPEALEQQRDQILWIDMRSPTPQEEQRVEALLGVDVPTQEEMAELELSNRLYRENGAFYFTVTLITHIDAVQTENKPYTFVVTDRQLITVRDSDIQLFRVLCERWQKTDSFAESNPKLLAISLFEAITNRLADMLEQNGREIDAISRSIFRANGNSPDPQNIELHHIIRKIGIEGDTLSKMKESLVSFFRLITFAKQSGFVQKDSEDDHRIDMLSTDVAALSDHATFLTNKVTFLMEATLGLIDLQQNRIIKIFSVAAVIFLPPTLVASIYGMNFHHMPELSWEYGYPLAIAAIALAAYLPYRFFKMKHWL